MKTNLKSLAFIAAIFAESLSLKAQTYTMNWGSSFSPAWTAGSSTSRTTTNIGTSGVTATVSFASNEASALSDFTVFQSPMISTGGSPFTSRLGANVANLALGMDLASNTSYVDVTIQFSAAVSNVVFNIADIDKTDQTSSSYFDQVRVTATNGVVPVTNPTLTKHNGTAVNTTTDTVLISSNIASANTTNNRGGNTPSSTTNQNGTVVVDFGSVSLTNIVIRYRNATGAQANPVAQAIAIGNINFQRTLLLPVTLTSFTGFASNNHAELNWQTAQEFHSDKFIVEKSTDGKSWSVAGTVKAAGISNTTTNYSGSYGELAAVNYYRLKLVDIDGQFSYSKTVTINTGSQHQLKAKIYPNPVTSSATLSVTSPSNTTADISIYTVSGVKVKDYTVSLNTGLNNINLNLANEISRGNYLLIVTNNNDKSKDSFQFTKQ